METHILDLAHQTDERRFHKLSLSYMAHNQINRQYKNFKRMHTECTICKKECPLEIAHVGPTVKQVIEKVLDEHYPGKTTLELYNLFVAQHNTVCRFAITCKACNKKLEQKLDRSRADQPAHTEQALIIIPCGTVEDLFSVPINDQ